MTLEREFDVFVRNPTFRKKLRVAPALVDGNDGVDRTMEDENRIVIRRYVS